MNKIASDQYNMISDQTQDNTKTNHNNNYNPYYLMPESLPRKSSMMIHYQTSGYKYSDQHKKWEAINKIIIMDDWYDSLPIETITKIKVKNQSVNLQLIPVQDNKFNHVQEKKLNHYKSQILLGSYQAKSNISHSEEKENKIKVAESSKFFTIKIIMTETKTVHYAFQLQHHREWFLNIFLSKLNTILIKAPYMKQHITPSITENLMKEDFINLCDGDIYKRSKYKHEWKLRYIMITKEGLMSSVEKGSKAKLFIKDVEEIWSRFQIIEKMEYVVLKMWYNLVKYQFGIPIRHVSKWLKAFYSLLRIKKIEEFKFTI